MINSPKPFPDMCPVPECYLNTRQSNEKWIVLNKLLLILLRFCRFSTRSFAIDTTQLDTLGISMSGDRKCLLFKWWNMCFLQRCRRASMQVSFHILIRPLIEPNLLWNRTIVCELRSWIKERKNSVVNQLKCRAFILESYYPTLSYIAPT